MRRLLPLLLLTVGVGLAASFGARNGDGYADYRATVAAGQDAALPGPTERLTDWAASGAVGWGLGVVLIGAGALLARRQQAADAVDASSGAADFPGTVRAALEELARLRPLLEVGEGDQPEVREAIDTLDAEQLQPLVEARAQLMARHGLVGFAEYFGAFSAGERNLARCWSALTDAHRPTAVEALARATDAFDEALAAWDRIDREAT